MTIINLRQKRKHIHRQEAEKKAQENRQIFGMKKAQKNALKKENILETKKFEAHKLQTDVSKRDKT